jgi:hypothetical protein
MFLGVCGSCALGVAWVFGREAWKEADAHDPRKLFAQEIFAAMKAELPVVSQNGSGLRGLKKRFLSRAHLRGEHTEV